MKARQRGVAIVLAMGVVALAALAATAILVSQSTWARQLELSASHAQAQRIDQAGLDWARAVLGDDRRANQVDYLGEPWALQLPPMPVENGSLAGHIDDQQGRFNLNNLVRDGQADLPHIAQFHRLLATLSLSPSLADSLVDWIDADNEARPQGAEDRYYLSQAAPHLSANRPLTDLAELALVRGFDADARERLRPFVSALPRATPVNVNTASAEVLSAVVEALSLDDARALVARRQQGYFREPAEFVSQLPRGSNAANEDIAVSSDYFIATMAVTIGEAQARGSALLARESAGWPTIIWRKYP